MEMCVCVNACIQHVLFNHMEPSSGCLHCFMRDKQRCKVMMFDSIEAAPFFILVTHL